MTPEKIDSSQHAEPSSPLPHERDPEALRYEAFFACTADAIIAFDMMGKMTYWNNGAERIFGYTAQEAIGQSYTILGTSEVYDFQHRIFTETLRGDVHQWYDSRRKHKNGTIIDVSITTSPLIIAGKTEGLIAIVRDISEKVRAAEELRERNAMLDALAQQTADLNAKLQANAKEKRQFVNMVLHDLRHPLTTMKTVLYLLRNHDSEAQREEYLEVVEGRVRALTDLLDELTEYHRIEAGRTSLLLETVEIGALIRNCVENFTPALIGGQVHIVSEVSEDLPQVTTDSGKLTHILLNLLSNALKFTPQGTISVQAQREDAQHWVLTVADTGAGIKPEVQSRIYEEFYQGEPLLHRQSGSGLGLSIAKQLCDALHGTMELTSAVGQGTRFRLVFPFFLEKLA